MKRITAVEKIIEAKRAEIAATESLLHRQRIELEELIRMRHNPQLWDEIAPKGKKRSGRHAGLPRDRN